MEQRPGHDQTWDMNNSSRSFQRQIVPHRGPILQDILGNDHLGPLSDVSNVVSAQRVAKTVCLVTENFGQRVDEAADLLSQMGLQS